MSGYLSSRLQVPQPRKQYVVRHELFHKLDQLHDKPIACLVAGAGSGKTTLLTTYMKERGRIPIWFTLDEDCDDLFIFWSYLIYAIPTLREDSYLQSFLNHSNQDTWQWMVEYVLAYIDGKELAIIVDNAHLLHQIPLLASLQFFLEHLPKNISILFSGRELPDLALHSWLMRGELLLINANELSFTTEEAMCFLQKTLHITKEYDALVSLCEKADGWIGGLQLLAIANQATSGLRDIQSRILNDYIEKEIFEPLSSEEQMFLVETSILRSFDEAGCRQYLTMEHVQACMHSLWEHHFIMTVLDEQKGIYTYHDLLKEFLINRFEQQTDDVKREYRYRASELATSRGETQESLHHLLWIPDYHAAMNIISSTPQTSEVLYYLRKIPLEIICDNPDFAYQYYFYFYSNYEEVECERIYEVISQHLHQSPTFTAFDDAMAIMRGTAKGVQILPLQELLSLPLKKETLTFSLLKDAFLLLAQNRYEESLQRLDQAKQFYEQTQNLYAGMLIYMEYAQIYEAYGHFHLALQAYQSMERLLKCLPVHLRSYELGLAGIYIKQMNLAKADELLQHIEERRSTEINSIALAGIHTRAQWFCAMKDRYQVEKSLLQVETSPIYDQLITKAGILKLYYAMNPSHPYFEEIYQCGKQGCYQGLGHADILLTYANVLMGKNEVQEAQKIAEELALLARKHQSIYVLIEVDLLQLLLLWKAQNTDMRKQNDVFLEAFCHACMEEIRLPFQTIRGRISTSWEKQVDKIVQQLDQKQLLFLELLEIIRKNTSLLTQREIEVLSLVAKGKTNKEIAEALTISLATVKTHMINIYGKLNITSRVEASQYYGVHFIL